MQVRAGVRQKVAAALEQAEALEAKIDSQQAEHGRALAAMQEDKSALQRQLAEAQTASHSLGLDLQAVQQKAARQEHHPCIMAVSFYGRFIDETGDGYIRLCALPDPECFLMESLLEGKTMVCAELRQSTLNWRRPLRRTGRRLLRPLRKTECSLPPSGQCKRNVTRARCASPTVLSL